LELFRHAKNWKKYFSEKLLPYIKGDVLEVGAGIGINTAYLAKDATAIRSWCLLEPDKNLAAQIDTNTDTLAIPNKKIINGIITDLGQQRFDTIIYIDVLEHIERSQEEIAKAKALLNPGGHLIILVPAYNFLFNKFDKSIGHYRRYNKKLLLTEVNNSLVKEKLFYLDSMGFFASLANKIFLKKELPTPVNVKFWDSYLVQLSKFFDTIFFRSFGKSLIGIFRKER
jgi:SAM-dependent methyltransferase